MRFIHITNAEETLKNDSFFLMNDIEVIDTTFQDEELMLLHLIIFYPKDPSTEPECLLLKVAKLLSSRYSSVIHSPIIQC